ncbi:MAG: glycosyltransferase [Actinomycetia bacterium]|nr:glycosyltransferase [Actinomycetes bacterium]
MQTYARELLRALPRATDAELVAVVQSHAVGELPPGVLPETRPQCRGVRRVVENLRATSAADLVHGLDVEVPLRAAAPSVTTVHDLALFDQPGAFRLAKRLGKPWSVKHSIVHADAVISVSAFTAERVRARFGRDSVVVHEAPGEAFGPPTAEAVEEISQRYALPPAFVLHVGNLEPRKEVPTLAEACEIAGVPLVLAGGAITTVDAPASARLIGQIAQVDLPALYAAATVVAYVSRYEGFALPPIEAMACGATVVATRVGALPDVAGEGIEFVPIGDPGRQADVLRALVADPARRAERRDAALAAAGALTWDAAARETVAVYRTLGVAA